ncbi:MAG: type II toxin-antitoxin system VapC family toxin [Acidobacteria bacterium]|nr:type II toxin-antitoxin system VapC family toxin [Acidobacteriota bacterium]
MRFVDTSFWVALLMARDRHHEMARTLWSGGSGSLLTTNHVVGETWTFLRRRAGHGAAVSFLNAAEQSPRLATLHADESLEAEARRWLRRHDEREFSFVDSVSFAVMRRRRIAEVLAFDGDFSAAGFVELRP